MSSSNNNNKRKVVGYGCTSKHHIANCGCSWKCVICSDTNPAMHQLCSCREMTKDMNADIIASSTQSSRSGAGNMIPTTPSTVATTPNNSNTKRRKKKSKNKNNTPTNNNTTHTNQPQLKHRPSMSLSTPAVGGRRDIDDDEGPRSKTWVCSICSTINPTSTINCTAGTHCRGNSLDNTYRSPRNNVSNGMSTFTAANSTAAVPNPSKRSGDDSDDDEDYVDDEGSDDDEDYDPSCLNVRSGDGNVYTKKSHTSSKNSGTYISKQQDGKLPSHIQQRNCIPMPSRCTRSSKDILNQRMEGMSFKSSGETPSNPCDIRDNVAKLKLFTEVGYKTLEGATLCQHFDDNGAQCSRVARTLLEPVHDTRDGAARKGEYKNQYCELHGPLYAAQEKVPLVERPCACEHGYERYADGRPLCWFGYMQIECYEEECTDTRHDTYATLCKRHALQIKCAEEECTDTRHAVTSKWCKRHASEQECAKKGCEETRVSVRNRLCLAHSNAEPCTGCNRPRNTGITGRRLCNECNKCKGCYGPRSCDRYNALCKACAVLQKCVKCKENPVVTHNANKCRACHQDYKACKKCGEFKVVGAGNHYCSEKCRSLCKAKGCTATAKARKTDRATGKVLTYKSFCGPKGLYCASGH